MARSKRWASTPNGLSKGADPHCAAAGFPAALTVAGDVDGIAFCPQRARHEIGHLLLVFDQQHPHSALDVPSRPRPD
jgi:hypothetical protein